MRKGLLVLALAVAMTTAIVSVVDIPVVAHDPGVKQGCTPGYWKNHTETWPPTGISPNDTVATYFSNATLYGLGGATVLAALDFGGGSGTVGAARILLRAAVAALLNAAHPDVNYPIDTVEFMTAVNNILFGGDRDTMLAAAALLDALNNLGCPF